MKNLITLFLLLLFYHATLISQVSPPPTQESINWMEGTWEGTGYQMDGSTWKIKLIHSDKRFSVEYPSLGCFGYWTITEKEKSKIFFVKTIQKGSCDQNVKIVVTNIDKKFISIAYFIPDMFPDKDVAFSVLRKEN